MGLDELARVDAAAISMFRVAMTTYLLIPGAGGAAWCWHRLVPELQQRGHDVVAVSLPAGDGSAGLAEYADAVIDAIGDHSELILVAQSLAGFTAPLVCERLPVDLLVLLNAMVPSPGETAGQWWADVTAEAIAAGAPARGARRPAGDLPRRNPIGIKALEVGMMPATEVYANSSARVDGVAVAENGVAEWSRQPLIHLPLVPEPHNAEVRS